MTGDLLTEVQFIWNFLRMKEVKVIIWIRPILANSVKSVLRDITLLSHILSIFQTNRVYMYPYQFRSSKLPSFLKVILKGPNSKILVKSVLRGHLCDKVKVVFYDRWPQPILIRLSKPLSQFWLRNLALAINLLSKFSLAVVMFRLVLKGPNSKILVKSVLRGHLCDKVKVVFYDRWPLNRGSIHMKFSMIGQEKCDLAYHP
jgi:hypothetical protein